MQQLKYYHCLSEHVGAKEENAPKLFVKAKEDGPVPMSQAQEHTSLLITGQKPE